MVRPGPSQLLAILSFSVILLSGSKPVIAQSTEVIITGKVRDARTGNGIPRARVRFRNSQTGASGSAETDAGGSYSLPLLPPGIYTIRAEEEDHQAREIQARELFVAERLELNFDLHSLTDVLQSGDYRSAL